MIFIIPFVITFLCTPLVRIRAIKGNIYDFPNDRKIHRSPVPLLGGLSIFLGFAISLLIYIPVLNNTMIIFLASLIIFAMGLYDDVYNLKVTWRMAVEIFLSLALVVLGIRIDIASYFLQNELLILGIDTMLTMVCIVGLINAINFIDGLDGLGGSISFWASLGFAIVGFLEGDHNILILSSVLLGCIVGFLPYNIFPAKIFMGDAGSNFMGFVFSLLSILTINRLTNFTSFVLPILFLAVPIFDMFYVVLNRFVMGNSIFLADRNHIHHRFLKKGFQQQQILFHINYYSMISLILGLIIYLNGWYRFGFLLLVVFTFLLSMHCMEGRVKNER